MSHPVHHFAEVGGHSIHYALIHRQWIKQGVPVLVFLHEGLGSIRQWKSFPATLCERVKLPALLYDRYGYGLSDERKEPFYPAFLHDEAIHALPALYKAVGITAQPKILIGHSDGGTIALIHAATHPEGILGVISEAAHVLVEPATVNGLLQVQEEYGLGKMRELLTRYHGERTDALVAGWIANWLSDGARDWNVEGYLPEIACPVLAIQGSEDHFGTVAQLASIQQRTKGKSTLLHIPGCGHIPHKQAEEEVTEAMAEFIFERIRHLKTEEP